MHFDKNSKTPMYYQIYEAFKTAILSQKLKANHKMPSIRALAKMHQISTTTVEKAYQQLLVEGYIESIPKSGYYTQSVKGLNPTKTISKNLKDPFKTYKNTNQSMDSIELSPLRKLTQEVFLNHQQALFESNHPQGEKILREALLNHLYEERGLNSTIEQMILAPGMQNLIIMLKAIYPFSTSVAYLNPGYDAAIRTFDFIDFKATGYDTIDQIINAKPRLIYLSPSNHYPTGEVISINDRLKLLNYANQTGAVIIEDDYNHIFRYNAYQIPSIHSLSKGKHVIYIGSLSRSLLLSTRLSYMILPYEMMRKHQNVIQSFSSTLSKLEQISLALYIKQGYYQKHLKKTYKQSKRKNEHLNDLLKTIDNSNVRILGLESNMHFIIETYDLAKIIQLLDTLNYGYKALSKTQVLIPYHGLSTKDMTTFVKALIKA